MKKYTLMLGLFLFLSACAPEKSVKEGNLPTLEPTSTVVPHVTPTPLPIIDLPEPVAVQWEDVSAHYAAMRPEYANDINDYADKNRYYIEATLHLDELSAEVIGTQVNRVVNDSPDTWHEVAYRLYPNLASLGGEMSISEALVNGETATIRYEERNSAVFVALPEPLAPGATVEITLDFILVAERGMNASYGLFGYQLDLFSAPSWHPVLSIYKPGEGWWIQRASPQGDPSYAEVALHEIYLTYADTLNIAIGGVSIGKNDNGDGTITEHFVTGPMRYSMLVASPVTGVMSQVVDGVTVNVHYLPGDERGAEWVLEVASKSVAIFDEQFGDYPYAEFDVVETFNITGVEFPGIVVVTNQNWQAGNVTVEFITAHEVAHQWWYGLVGNDQVDEPFVDESLTSFSEILYWRGAYDDAEQRANDAINFNRTSYNNFRGITGNVDLPMGLPTEGYPQNQYGMLIYVKGRVFYNELETLIGRDAFGEALRGYFQEKRYGIARTEDLIRHFETASGQDLDAFFYEWIGDFEGLDPAIKAEVDAQRSRDNS